MPRSWIEAERGRMIAKGRQVVARPEMLLRKLDVRGTVLRKHRMPLNGTVRISGRSSSEDFDSRYAGSWGR
jgi:hypothetical protein